MPLSINDYRSWQSVVQLAVFALGWGSGAARAEGFSWCIAGTVGTTVL
jgi:hypothetical protein